MYEYSFYMENGSLLCEEKENGLGLVSLDENTNTELLQLLSKLKFDSVKVENGNATFKSKEVIFDIRNYDKVLKNTRAITRINFMKVIKKAIKNSDLKNKISRGIKIAALNVALISGIATFKLNHKEYEEMVVYPEYTMENSIDDYKEKSKEIVKTVTEIQNQNINIEEVTENTSVTFLYDSDNLNNSANIDQQYEGLEEENIQTEYEVTQTGEEVNINTKQAGISYNHTNYPSFYDRWTPNTRQQLLAIEWDEKGRTSDRGIATIDGRYLVAMTETFGVTGDDVDVVLTDGAVIPCKIADSKSSNDANWTPYGHMLTLPDGQEGVDVIEWEASGEKEDIEIDDWYGKGVDYVVLASDAKVKTYIR
ncbi:MAG: hypothetical protein IJ565_04075 [Bacilli bacterium]|nr:hypothetical protein [Bacilli bacterium]